MRHRRPRTVRLRLTLLYSGLFFLSGAALLGITYLLVRRATVPDLIVPTGATGTHGPSALTHALANPEVAHYVRHVAEQQYARSLHARAIDLHNLLLRFGIGLAIMTVTSIALGWLVAGRVLRPLQEMTSTTRRISERNLSERLAVDGPRDELKDLADTIDGLLGRLEAHVTEQQRFVGNTSHELRTPLAITQALLDTAREEPRYADDALVERLHAVNARAIDLTEALLLLSRAGQKSFVPEEVDLSLLAEEAAETLLPLATKRGIAIDTSGDPAPALGSPALLLQLVTNLVHNAIVHNLPEGGRVWVTTSNQSDRVMLTVENSGEKLAPELISTLHEPFQRGATRIRSDHGGVGLGLAIVKRIVEVHDGTLFLESRPDGGLRSAVELPAGQWPEPAPAAHDPRVRNTSG